MGLLDRFRRPAQIIEQRPQYKIDNVVGAKEEEGFQSYTNSNITFGGDLAGYDYVSLLRNKQENIVSFYQLVDYIVDADAIVRGIIRNVYVPASTSSPWFLTGAKEKTILLFEDYYKKIRLREVINGIMLEYWKYGNVFAYLLKGRLITLPVHKCKIGSLALNGMPIVDFDCQSILNEFRAKNYSVHEGWIKENNLDAYFKGYPEEVKTAIDKGQQYAQLNPENTFVLQGDKESWQRYSIPFIAACLIPLAKKALIEEYEKAILRLGAHGFVHATYGDPNKNYDMLPDRNALTEVRRLFRSGMTDFPLVVTNHLAKAAFVQADTADLFQWDIYRDVNNDILSAGGISGVIVNGVSQDGSTFASAQVSMQTAEARINEARDEFCDMMNRINERLVEEIDSIYNLKEIPEFHFAPLDLSGKKALREACKELWQNGVVSTQTFMELNGYSMDREITRRTKEQKNADRILVSRDATTVENTSVQEEPSSDPEAAIRGKMPKPSSPEGSLDEDAV